LHIFDLQVAHQECPLRFINYLVGTYFLARQIIM
jgi:hypothetical protein